MNYKINDCVKFQFAGRNNFERTESIKIPSILNFISEVPVFMSYIIFSAVTVPSEIILSSEKLVAIISSTKPVTFSFHTTFKKENEQIEVYTSRFYTTDNNKNTYEYEIPKELYKEGYTIDKIELVIPYCKNFEIENAYFTVDSLEFIN